MAAVLLFAGLFVGFVGFSSLPKDPHVLPAQNLAALIIAGALIVLAVIVHLVRGDKDL